VTEQRVVAGERVSEGHATKAWPVVRHDGDRSGCFTDHVVVGVDDVHHAAVGTEVVEVEDPCGLDNGPAEATERILAARRRGDGGGEAVLGGVVDDPWASTRRSSSLSVKAPGWCSSSHLITSGPAWSQARVVR
jgi:hypothetical protein